MGGITFQNRSAEFKQALLHRVLVADGAMGTALYAKGIFVNRCYDELNLSLPALVRDVHQDYLRAGAQILETNTYGANRRRLAGFGFAEKLRQINQAGVRIAKEVAQDQAFVAGAVGPLGVRLEPLGPVSFAEARELFREQVTALVEAGVDLIILESFRDLDELREAVLAVREAAGREMPLIAQVAMEDDGTLEDGTSAANIARALTQWPVDVIGLNCSSGPRVMLEAIEAMAPHTSKPLSAMPNAGLPMTVDGRNLYLCSPEYMAQYSRRFLEAGAKIVGGCCGTTAAHIKEIRNEARSFQPGGQAHTAQAEERKETPNAQAKIPLPERSGLGAKLAAGQFVTFVEILPPKGVDAAKEIAGAKLCKDAGIDCINVPDGPRASARLSAQATCQLIQQHAGIEAVLHFCCRDRNILGIQSELLGAHAGGLRNLICITGDPPRMGTYPDATAVFDVDSIGLIRIANNLNQGLDLGGNPMGSQTSLLLGAGANPGSLHIDEELRRLEKKVEAGAEYFVTQPVFDLQLLEKFLARTAQFKIPVIAGIWPLTSLRNAEFMVNELRVPVPDEYLERMRGAVTAEAARAAGVAIAREMVQRVRPLTAGVQLSAPFGRYEMAIEVAQAIR
ncbi:MAG: bifunctional homocysteine S-methyltransferase/methylenetetrahydrofolate reductase [Acidobacteriota bacterium]|nr:bifunctional homocysteine S-methyltransferase/methylenetetrahydrofolate reductase [Acidobacteriota bacterium]